MSKLFILHTSGVGTYKWKTHNNICQMDLRVCQEDRRESAGNQFNVHYDFIHGQPLWCLFFFCYQSTLSQTMRLAAIKWGWWDTISGTRCSVQRLWGCALRHLKSSVWSSSGDRSSVRAGLAKLGVQAWGHISSEDDPLRKDAFSFSVCSPRGMSLYIAQNTSRSPLQTQRSPFKLASWPLDEH